jgi:hypothetical protein
LALLPGSRLGAYEILAAPGAGGMGEVYKGRDTRLDCTVAISIAGGHATGAAEITEALTKYWEWLPGTITADHHSGPLTLAHDVPITSNAGLSALRDGLGAACARFSRHPRIAAMQ